MDGPLRILLIDDDENSFVITRETLQEVDGRSVALDWCDNATDGLRKIMQSEHVLYLLDYRLGENDGIEVLRQARHAGCQAPIIIMTGQTAPDLDRQALEAGATDYVAKEAFDTSRLEHTIRYALERQRLVQELTTERYLLKSLMESLPDNIYFKDRDSRFLRISRAMARWFEVNDPTEALGKTDFDFFTEEHAIQARQDELELMDSEEPVLGKEEKETWPDGRTTWVSTSKMPLRDEAGQVVGTFGISRDITEQKEALIALKKSERQNRLIVDTALDAFVAMDETGTIVDWNPQAEKTFGWSREEALGENLGRLLVPQQYRDQHEAGLAKYLATGEQNVLQRRLELTALHRNGSEFPVEMTISPISDDVSTLFAAFIHDISKRKKAERDLRESKEAAESANRAKSDFLANMSHEIRTPMNAIIGMTELVLDMELTQSQRDYLSMVRSSADSLLTLINDILDFSKIEAGKLELEAVTFSLRECLGDTLKSLALRAHREELELASHIDSAVPDWLVGDPARLRQIIVNLVGNAIKFTEQGEVVVHVDADEQLNGGVLLHFAVSDTGIGIPPDKIGSVFGAFEQADTSTTRKYGGTGLGLTICARLSRLMNGTVWAESELGKGSTFHFTARFGLSDAPPKPVERRIVQGNRILVVDDNATNRLILDEMLSNWGIEVRSVESVDEAIVALREARETDKPFHLVLSDVHMPERDGFDLAQEMHDDPQMGEAVIMMLTSGDRSGDIAKCRDLGVASYLRKPVKQSELFDVLVSALGIDATDESVPASESNEEAEDFELPPLRVLLAEDSIVNQKLALALLNKWGLTVSVAMNGAEAVEQVTAQDFDLVLMDVQMPEMDGLEATQKIRAQEEQSGGHVPIIAMTAHAMTGDREQCLDAGMDSYVSKPVRAWQLKQEIGQFFRERIAAASSAEDQSSEASGDTAAVKPEFAVDWPAALKIVQGDRALLRDVAAAFLEESRQMMSQLKKARENCDGKLLQRSAHTIKASFRTFGVEDAHDIAFDLERAGKEDRLDDAMGRMPELEAAAAAVREQLKCFVDTREIPS
ncbi:MAG: hybrid sensor histidine kinase/response regulator [Planctomycetota bacterium]|jgi:PAS domain S-box-containing protein